MEELWQAADSAPVRGTPSVDLGPDDSLTQWTYQVLHAKEGHHIPRHKAEMQHDVQSEPGCERMPPPQCWDGWIGKGRPSSRGECKMLTESITAWFLFCLIFCVMECDLQTRNRSKNIVKNVVWRPENIAQSTCLFFSQPTWRACLGRLCMQQGKGQVGDTGMALPRRARVPGQGAAFLLGSVLVQLLSWLTGELDVRPSSISC